MTRSKTLTAALTVLMTIFAARQSAAAGKSVNQCGAITASGSYVLARNLTATGDCIVIQADYVTLDLDGNTITGSGAGIGVNTASPVRGAVVRNGSVSNFQIGVAVDLGGSIERVRSFHNTGPGLWANNGSRVVDSTSSENLGDGIFTGSNCLVRGNTVEENSGAGINVADGSVVLGNGVYANLGRGIYASTAVTITDNTISSTGGRGIDAAGGGTITNNTVNSADVGILAQDHTTIGSNSVQGTIGIQVVCPSTLFHNTVGGGVQQDTTFGACTIE